jgi:hypothetical protein
LLYFKNRSLFVIAAIALAALACTGCAQKRASGVPLGTFYIEDYSEQWHMHMYSVTLQSDGTIRFGVPYISSYMPPPCKYKISGDTLTAYAAIQGEQDESFFGVADRAVICTFAISDNGNMLTVVSTSVPLFAADGTRYIYATEAPPTEW